MNCKNLRVLLVKMIQFI